MLWFSFESSDPPSHCHRFPILQIYQWHTVTDIKFPDLWGAVKGEKMTEEVLRKKKEVLLESEEVLLQLDTTGSVMDLN